MGRPFGHYVPVSPFVFGQVIPDLDAWVSSISRSTNKTGDNTYQKHQAADQDHGLPRQTLVQRAGPENSCRRRLLQPADMNAAWTENMPHHWSVTAIFDVRPEMLEDDLQEDS